jgi:hypothetical protein
LCTCCCCYCCCRRPCVWTCCVQRPSTEARSFWQWTRQLPATRVT